MTSRVPRLLGAAAACVAAAAVVLLATYLIGWVARWDVAAFEGMRLLHAHELVWSITNRLTRLADPLPTALMAATIFAAGVSWGRPRHAVGALLLVAGGAVAGTALKALLAHPRYGSLLGSQQLSPDAFPSGHAIAAMSLGLAAVLVTPRRWRTWAAVAAATYALAVGTALVINGWHYPSDILGGFLVSACVGLTVLAGMRATERLGEDRVRVGRQAGPVASAPALGMLTVSALALVALGLSRAGELLSYTEANTSAVVAAIVIALASVALVSAVAAEANGR